jgi:uncharacterized protein (DUF2249 family)
MFEQELQFFISNQEKFVKKYSGKTLVIVGEKILGVYNSPLEAYFEALKTQKLGTFMIQEVEKGPEAYTVTISSLVNYC